VKPEPHPDDLTDLHRHLDGSLREATLRELAVENGLELPATLRFEAGMGLDEALRLFRHTLAVLQTPAAVERVAREICEDAAREGVTALEVRFAPQLHTGALMEAIVDAALAGIDGRAGLLLCVLYGESPEIAERLVAVAERRPGVVGLDLAGGPQPHHAWGLADYAGAFTRARELGLGRTVHAGEGRPPAEIGAAISLLHAQRIGHGTSLLGDPAVVDLTLERGVVIEACPTSNVHTSAIASLDEHPLPRWLSIGVKACVNSDNTLFSATDAPTELERAASLPGMTSEGVQACLATGRAAAFPAR
jgi:adenosine deaminase